ncbi:MAG: hypothetical protein KDK12_17220 [Rhodobacteraceae bacterium]|nr:hypothetical protein [Paracoccaceae bacterium]
MEESHALMERSAELQQRWHGWGSPVGLGIVIVSLGVFIALAGWAGSLYAG